MAQEPTLQQATPSPHALRTEPIFIGLDIGSTTVKAVVVDPLNHAVLWHDYQRHHTRQPACVLEFLARIEAAFPAVAPQHVRIFVTGSGAGPMVEPLGAKFVQEVNAVAMAVADLHPDVHAVIELGGQDAKILILREHPVTGDKQVVPSMNDKCASGTGATIDKCLIKAGVPAEVARNIIFDPGKLHHVAAKCGVFAETDIVNLVKTGVPGEEILNSLADAIVMQNLSVLTRGNTLKPNVLLLGGPNTYLPFLVACWRLRIAEIWRERGVEVPDRPIEELIFVPQNADLYAALGAVLFGQQQPEGVGQYRGRGALETYSSEGRKARLAGKAGPPLSKSPEDALKFTANYRIPKFVPPDLPPGSKVRVALGLDGGSTSSKCVLVQEDGTVLLKEYQLSKGNPILDCREMLTRLRDSVQQRQWDVEIIGFGVTGYAGPVLEKALLADVHLVETVAHRMSAVHYCGEVDVICDIGGQDIKVLFLKHGDIDNFRLSNQCSAGNGMLLQAMADQFGVAVTDYADTAFSAEMSPDFSYGCAVFLDADRVNFQKEGFSKEEMLAGLARVLPKNVWQYVVGIPRMAELGTRFVLQGGTQYNLAAVKAQVDYICERVPGAEVFVHPHPGEAGAIGVAMEVVRRWQRTGIVRWVGLDAAIGIQYISRTDESTRCHFCPNDCSRTFIDTWTPSHVGHDGQSIDGEKARYIAGFSCEKGTVEDEAALKALTRERARLRKAWPNLVEWEAKELFRHRFTPQALPQAGSALDSETVTIDRLLRSKRQKITRGFERSSAQAVARRQTLRIGIPKVLNVWSVAPFLRTYLEALGIERQNVVFSIDSGEDMWARGGRYGSIDPCFPSKVAQAHIHDLLFIQNEEKPINAIWLPAITHVPSPLVAVMDHASCPIVQGVSAVMKAAFTKEKDWFAEKNVTWLGPAMSFTEPFLLQDQLFECFGEFLGITRDENDFATQQAWKSMDDFDKERERRGRAVLEEVEAQDGVALLVLGRPYHSDPGLNHEVLQEFQALGYPILSMGSIPTDRQWLHRFFREDLVTGLGDIFDINDVWPENYSVNSAYKVWCAKFAARHPNVAVLDLSSFKCGHDSPIYATVDKILAASRTPMSALHDIDANKPGGSIGIRVRTYGYTLDRHQERLQDLSHKKKALQQRIEEKRLELLEKYRVPGPAVAQVATPAPQEHRTVPTRKAWVALSSLARKARAWAQ